MTLGAWPLTLRAYLASLAVSGQRWRKATCGDELRPCTHFCARSLFHAPVSHWRLMMLPDHPSLELVLILERWALSLAKAQSYGITHHVCPSPPRHWRAFYSVMLFCFPVCPWHPARCQPPRIYVCVCVCVSTIVRWMSKWGQVLGILIMFYNFFCWELMQRKERLVKPSRIRGVID